MLFVNQKGRRDRMVVGFITTVQSVAITTKVESLNPTRYNIM